MKIRTMPMALAIAAALALTGCPQGQGGGGGAADRANTTQDQAQGADAGRDTMAANETRGYEDRAPIGEKISANLTTDLTGSARDFAEAYARAPWVHANVAAGDFERADDDLQFISDQIADLQEDRNVSAAIKGRLATVKPLIAKLDAQLGAKDRAAVTTAKQLVDKFAMTSSEPAIVAWMGQKPTGGGAGTGAVGPKRVGEKEVGPKHVGPKEVGPKHVGPKEDHTK